VQQCALAGGQWILAHLGYDGGEAQLTVSTLSTFTTFSGVLVPLRAPWGRYALSTTRVGVI